MQNETNGMARKNKKESLEKLQIKPQVFTQKRQQKTESRLRFNVKLIKNEYLKLHTASVGIGGFFLLISLFQ